MEEDKNNELGQAFGGTNAWEIPFSDDNLQGGVSQERRER